MPSSSGIIALKNRAKTDSGSNPSQHAACERFRRADDVSSVKKNYAQYGAALKDGDDYVFHEGYWGTEVGFYGGINYGYGYSGRGYEGGRWDNGHFDYNQSVSHADVFRNHNVYNTRVEDNSRGNRVSFNGGNGGRTGRATSQEEAAGREHHIAPSQRKLSMSSLPAPTPSSASANQGKPPVAATSKPGAFKGSGAVAAKEGGTVPRRPDERCCSRLTSS